MRNKWYTEKVQNKIERIIESRLILVGEYVRGQVSILAPKKTGNLRASYVWVTNKKSGKVGSAAKKKKTLQNPNKLSVRIGTNVDYAIPIEFGTNKRRRWAPLRLGLKISRHEIKKIMKL